MKYYGEVTESVEQLAQEYEADLNHHGSNIPSDVRYAMKWLARELHHLAPLVETIDAFMRGKDDVTDVVLCLRKTIKAGNDHACQQ